jgi:hypothetical protein
MYVPFLDIVYGVLMVAVFTSTNAFPTSQGGADAIMFGGINYLRELRLIVDTMIATQSMTGSYGSTAQATVGQSSGAGGMRLGGSDMGAVISASIAVIVSIWIILR